MKKVELLAPAGDFEKLKTACYFGADAVYVPGANAAVEASPSPDDCTSGAHPADTRAAWAAAMAAQATNVLRESEMLRSVGKTSAVSISFILTLLDPYFLFLYAAV